MPVKRFTTLRFALSTTLPVALSYFFISTAYGILLGQAGYSFVWAFFSSAVVYAGAFQFVLATFLTSGASLLTVGLTALFMNSRHVFYGLSFVQKFKKTGKMYPYMIHTLTDETYSLYCSLKCPNDVDETRALKYIAVLAHAYWIAGSVFGAVVGNVIPVTLEGVDFCLTALFVTIVIDQWKAAKSHFPALAGFFCGILCLLAAGADKFILPALIFTSAILIMYNMNKKSRQGEAQK